MSDCTINLPNRLTLHKVFGPRGPFLHSGLSVLPQVTQTCIPSPSPAPPALGPFGFADFFGLFLSLCSLSFGGLPTLGGLIGCCAKAGEEAGEEEVDDSASESSDEGGRS